MNYAVVANIGVSKSRDTEARNLAITAKLTISSEQAVILAAAKKAGAKVDAKTLALGKDAATDALLTDAAQANQFDEIFIKTFRAKLQTYRQTTKKIHDAINTPSTKKALAKSYSDVGNLISKDENTTPTQ